MKKLKLLVIVAITIMATSCISIIEELTLNKDGSGTFSYTIDITALMELGVMDQARSMTEEIGDDKIEVDTVMNAYLTMEANGQLEDMEKPEFWKKVRLISKISEKEKVGNISFILDFDKIEEVDFFLKNLSKLLETDETAEMLGSMGLIGNSGAGSPFTFKKKLFSKSLTRAKQESSSELSKVMEEEGGEMMKMMLQGAEYTTVVNLPGKTKKVSNAKSITSNDDKTVTLSVDLLDYLEGKADLSNNIKFK
ncbi:MAG: hypothetical protein ACJA1N_000650 [Saprospiraceae bacterium]|mgnify:CR=1 FL=1|jgi:hypothetical protein|tara:strand:+ start:88 stop:843 length:756 start_codon:yes stop_codon:yes gene_type:complete